MLELRQITKIYPTGSEDVKALKGIDLTFRKNEFVAILGPSGCGKTTMLNIIGGLDRYTSGDLIINGKSTTEYRARDWDAYRNHSVGFVFQSYNLIPHQSVLQNVELALTLSGVSKSERRRRAREALEKVGLGDQLRKRPSEMSGGQMQRVAIARAIVNNPDIVLADEPTGALDSETSVQVMEILKEISRDRLVVMVTHNPDLADTYATRIVKMLDGLILSDTAPVTPEEAAAEPRAAAETPSKGRKKKPSMSLFTSFGLSLNNLFTKKSRTALTSFAGSIGIIGIALIYAVSNGATTYINTVQEETLSSYPITIEATHIDTASLLSAFLNRAESGEEHEFDAVYQKSLLYNLLNSVNSLEERKNDLRAFKAYIEKNRSDPENKLYGALSAVQYSYSPELLIYTENVDGSIIRSDTQKLLSELIRKAMGMDVSSGTGSGTGAMSSMFGSSSLSSSSSLWREIIPGENGEPVSEVTKRQYDVIYGSWPERSDEVILFLDENNELNDLTLYALGLKSEEEISALIRAAIDKTPVEYKDQSWSYEEICSREYRAVLNSDLYTLDEKTGTYRDLRESEAGLKYLYDNALVLRVSGIAKPNEDSVNGAENGGIGYTCLLTETVLTKSSGSPAVQAQKDDPGTDIFTGLPFKAAAGEMESARKAEEFKAYVETLTDQEKTALYLRIQCTPDAEETATWVQEQLSTVPRDQLLAALVPSLTAQTGMSEDSIRQYLDSMDEEDLNEMFSRSLEEQYKRQYAAKVMAGFSALSPEILQERMTADFAAFTEEQNAEYYELLEFSDSSYEENLVLLGCVDLDDPSAINLYAASFSDKDRIADAISDYNETVDDLQEIQYTDYVGLIMSSVTTIINAITYVLIAFVAVSLVVSSIMIGVITLISVQERTKEIGILRAIGASKKNVSSMFNAETVLIGFASGILGVLITYLLCFPINAILRALTGIKILSASLPLPVALVLILISVLLTLIAGVIPSRSAAKKDPVVALRTE